MTAPIQVLFLCTGNSARSILAEAILAHEGGSRFAAYSAGSQPKAEPHPQALARLTLEGVPTEGLRSKSWDEFAAHNAPALDVVITVCDSAAGETCPYWPGAPVTVHWGLPDPADASPDRAPAAFDETFRELRARIGEMLALPLAGMDASERKRRLAAIAKASAP